MTKGMAAGDPVQMFDELVQVLAAGAVFGPRKFLVLALAQTIADSHGAGLDESEVLAEARRLIEA